MLKAIKHDLPQFPSDVAEKWLLPIARRPGFGWPPTTTNDWRFVLGRDNDLSYLKGLAWRRQELELTPPLFDAKVMKMIVGLFQAHVLNEPNIYSMSMTDGAERFQNCCMYLKNHGTFPWPIVLQRLGTKYHVLDGAHRLCAFFYLYGYFNVESADIPCLVVEALQPAWVAS